MDIEYGLVQVSAVIRDGRIADIKWLQDPEDIDLSKLINQDAMPQVDARSDCGSDVQVDIVTGATFTALGFRLSLSTALAQAATGVNPPQVGQRPAYAAANAIKLDLQRRMRAG